MVKSARNANISVRGILNFLASFPPRNHFWVLLNSCLVQASVIANKLKVCLYTLLAIGELNVGQGESFLLNCAYISAQSF